MSAWSYQIRIDIQLISWNTSGYSQFHRLITINFLTFFLTNFLTYLLIFLLSYFLTIFLTYLLAVEVRQGTLRAESPGWGPTKDIARKGPAGNTEPENRGGGPAGNTERRESRLRSGKEYWAQRIANIEHRESRLRSGKQRWAQKVAVEVRQGTLRAESRGWGPAEG